VTDPSKKPQYDIRVSVRARYLPEQSDPPAQVYRHAYTVTITNTGSVGAQLISRHWIIEGESGEAQEVKGLGVVGHQPLLKPGQGFEYTSASQIPTPDGRMQGSYFFVAEDGTRFDVPVEPFRLSARLPDDDADGGGQGRGLPSGRTLH
jgi:ApaG protein